MSHGPVFTRRDILFGLAIVLIAFLFRLVIIVDRAHAANNAGAFDPLPVGSDQRTYYQHIEAYSRGEFPPPRYFYQPGMSYFMIGATRIMRTDNVGALRVFVAFLASVNCGLFVAVTRLIVDRRNVAWLAGLLLAIYPVSAFYDTDFVITSQTTELLTLALLGIALLWRYPRQWAGVLFYGGSFGILAFTRFDTLFVAPILGVWLLYVRRDRLAVLQVLVAALLCIIIMLPIVLHNLSNGANYLITPVGTAEIYRGNNRDTNGTYGGGQASRVTTTEYMKYLKKDIALSPRRFGELVLHKIGLYLSNEEPGNNLNYVLSGENVSPLLRAVPLDFRILMALFLFGLALMRQQNRAAAWLLGMSFVGLMLAILMIWVEARLRTPTVIFMMPACAYGVITATEQIRQAWRHGRLRETLQKLSTPIPVIALVLIAAQWMNTRLPRPLTVRQLPTSAHTDGRVFDNTLQLVGWKVQQQYSPAGIIQPFRPYVVTFYWQLLRPTSVDYSFSLGYFVDGERVLGYDYPIGLVSYPPYPTSKWVPGTIYVEHVGLTYKHFDGPTGVTGPLLLSVYPERDAERLLVAEGTSASTAHIEIADVAIIWGPGLLPEKIPKPYVDVPVGDVLLLKGWDYPNTAHAGETIAVTLGWQTTDVQIAQNLIFSVGLLDETGTLVTNADSPPQNGGLLSSSLPRRHLFADTKQITLPTTPGVYVLYALVYDYDTGARLLVADSPQTWFELGTVTVQTAP